MTPRARPLLPAFLALMASSLAIADDPDLATRLDREFARLSSEDVEEREAAAAAIAKAGRAASDLIAKRLETEKDPEVRARLKQIVRRIPVVEAGSRKWRPVATSRPLSIPADDVALSRDGKFVATVCEADHRIILSDGKTGKPLREFAGDEFGTWRGIGFSPDGRFLLALEEDGEGERARVWRTEDGVEQKAPPSESAGQTILLFHGDNGLTFVAEKQAGSEVGDPAWIVDASGVTRVWKSRIGISPDGKRLLETQWPTRPGEETVVSVRSTANGEELFKRTLHPDLDHAAGEPFAIAPDGSALAYVGGGHVHVVPLEKNAKEEVFGEEVEEVVWAGKGFVTAHAAETRDTLKWWRDGAVVRTVPAPVDGRIYRLQASAGVLAVWMDHGRFSRRAPTAILSLETGEVLDRFKEVDTSCEAYGSVFIARDPERARVYHGGKRVAEFPVAWGQVSPWPARASDEALVFRRGDETVLRDLRAEGAPEIALLPHAEPIQYLYWTSEGVVAHSEQSRPALIDPASGAVLKRSHSDGYVEQFHHFVDLVPLKMDGQGTHAISPDGLWVAKREGAVVRVRDVARLKEERRIELEVGGTRSDGPLEFSPDGSLLAVVTREDGVLDLYDLKTDRRIARAEHFKGTILDIAFASEGPTLVVTSTEGPPGDERGPGTISLFAADGTPRGQFPWPGNNDNTFVAHDRWVLAQDHSNRLATSMFCLDLKSPADPRRIEFPVSWGGGFFIPPTGDRFVLESRVEQGMFVVSCTEGFLGMIAPSSFDQSSPFEPSGATGALDDGTLLVLRPDGLQIWYGPTLELAAIDPSIKGTSLAVSPDGKRLAVADWGVVTVYELK